MAEEGSAAAGEVRLCRCHGVEMYRNNSDGGWRCRVKVRERQRAADLDYWHKAWGGYAVRRRRHLRQQRAHVEARLTELDKEGTC